MSTNSTAEIYSVDVCKICTSHIDGFGSFLFRYEPFQATLILSFSFIKDNICTITSTVHPLPSIL